MTQIEFDRSIAITRREWFSVLNLKRGTLANAEDINEIQRRVLDGLEVFASEADATMLRLVEQLISQISAIEQMQLRFEAKVEARIKEIYDEILAILDAFSKEQLARIGDFEALIMKRLEDLEATLRAEIQTAKAEMIVSTQRYTDAAYTKLMKLLFRTRYYETYFTPAKKATDKTNYTDVETTEYTVFECPADCRYYIHGYSWRVWLISKKWIESGTDATTQISSMVYQQGPGGGAVAMEEQPIMVLRPGEKVLGRVSVDGGTWDYFFRMQGYLVPRELWEIWPKDGVI